MGETLHIQQINFHNGSHCDSQLSSVLTTQGWLRQGAYHFSYLYLILKRSGKSYFVLEFPQLKNPLRAAVVLSISLSLSLSLSIYIYIYIYIYDLGIQKWKDKTSKILDFGRSWKWVVIFTLRKIYLWGKSHRHKLESRAGGTQGRSGHRDEDSEPGGFSSDRPLRTQPLSLLKYPGSCE
jgi:hypothetical protein